MTLIYSIKENIANTIQLLYNIPKTKKEKWNGSKQQN